MTRTTLLEEETVAFARDLIRIDTVNTGVAETIGDGETRAALFIHDRLAEVGITAEIVEPVPGRASLVARLRGRDAAAPALLVHAHTDVVPVEADDWTHPPFAADVVDGFLYGRGAVDMKNYAGTVLAVARHFAREGIVPRRDLVLAFLADEESGGVWGAGWLVEHRPDLFAGVSEALGEVGGFSVPLAADADTDAEADADADARRAYLVATGEKGVAWATLRARGHAAHGSRPTPPAPRLGGARAHAPGVPRRRRNLPPQACPSAVEPLAVAPPGGGSDRRFLPYGGALLVFVLCCAWDVLFLHFNTLPATVPIGVAIIVLELKERASSRRPVAFER